jgi:hypothetical protein
MDVYGRYTELFDVVYKPTDIMFRGTTFFLPSFINYIRLYPHRVDGYNPYKQTWLENPSLLSVDLKFPSEKSPSRPPRPSW